MRTEAASGGLYHSDVWQRDFPKVQLRTIEEMLSGNGFDLPPTSPPSASAAPKEGKWVWMKPSDSANLPCRSGLLPTTSNTKRFASMNNPDWVTGSRCIFS